MASLDELTWKEYTDFTGGLWERGDDRECVPNGLLECTDCFPNPNGGLSAFARFEPFIARMAANMPDPSHALGIWTPSSPEAPGTLAAMWAMTIEGSSSPFTFRVFSKAYLEELDLDATAWSNVYSNTSVSSASSSVRMDSYRTDANGYLTYGNVPIYLTGGSTHGIYRFGIGGTRVYQPGSTNFIPLGLWTHQSRLLTIANDGSRHNSIVYTDAGVDTLPSTANILKPMGEASAPLSFLTPFPPSELVFMKSHWAFGSVQGSITAPTVRQFEYNHLTSRGYPVRTSLGLVMVIANEGAYAFDGNTLQHISAPILGDAMGGTPLINTGAGSPGVEDVMTAERLSDLIGAGGWEVPAGTSGGPAGTAITGQLGAYEHWVFFNNGYMLDARTGAWFKQTSVPGARYWASDNASRRMYVSTNRAFSTNANGEFHGESPFYWSRMGESSWKPMDTYSFTLPLIDNVGQKTTIRELEYHLTTFNDDATIEVELTYQRQNTQQTITKGPYKLAPTSPDTARIPIPGVPADWWKVRTILKSNRSDAAAPSLARMFCGTQDATRNRDASRASP